MEGGCEADFDDIVLAENLSQQKGFDEGYTIGFTAGIKEGEHLGVQHAVKLCSEIGFYKGFAQVYKDLLEKEPNAKQKTIGTLDSIISLVDAFPVDNPQDERIQSDMLKIRAKFKQICSVLGVHPDFNATENKGISF